MTSNSSSGINFSPNEQSRIPAWINENFFEEICEQHISGYQKIVKFKTETATAPGENYLSIMVRVVLDVELKDGSINSTSYVLKTCLEASDGANFVSKLNFFPREKLMYQINLPKFEKLYKEAGVDIQLGPKCLHIEETPERITLVFEDLKQRHFQNIDRLKGMDMAHAKCALQKIAEFHAASAVYHELYGPFDKVFKSNLFSELNRSTFKTLNEMRLKTFIKAMHTWGLDNIEYYIENISRLDDVFNEGIRVNQADPNEFNVLNHGDCWSNNIMFNYKENGEINEMLFVDFQVCKWVTPAQDLWYFIVTSIDLDIKLKNFDHFIHIYHKRLVECLKLLKYPKRIPTLKEIHILMLKYGYWAAFITNDRLASMLYPTDKDANLSNLLKDGPEAEAFRLKLYSNPIYAKVALQLYPFLDDKGIWNVKEN